MTRAVRTNPKTRKKIILLAAIQLSKRIGYKSITRDAVAKEASVSSPLVGKYFPKMKDVEIAVIKSAIEQEIIEILAQGLAINDPQVLKISSKLKKKVIAYLTNK